MAQSYHLQKCRGVGYFQRPENKLDGERSPLWVPLPCWQTCAWCETTRRCESVRLEELHRQPLLQRELGSSTRRALDEALRDLDIQPKVVMELGSREALREAAARGIGIGVVSEAEFIPDARFVPVRIEGDPAITETYLYCLEERRNSRTLTSFFDVALALRQENGKSPQN